MTAEDARHLAATFASRRLDAWLEETFLKIGSAAGAGEYAVNVLHPSDPVRLPDAIAALRALRFDVTDHQFRHDTLSISWRPTNAEAV